MLHTRSCRRVFWDVGHIDFGKASWPIHEADRIEVNFPSKCTTSKSLRLNTELFWNTRSYGGGILVWRL